MINPVYKYLAILVAVLLVMFGCFRFGVNYEKGQDARAEALVRRSQELGALGAADAIAKLKPVYKTFRVQAETITREKTVYRDCVSDPTVERLLDTARTGGQPGKDAGDNRVPDGSGQRGAP
jgi:hypothetical protein